MGLRQTKHSVIWRELNIRDRAIYIYIYIEREREWERLIDYVCVYTYIYLKMYSVEKSTRFSGDHFIYWIVCQSSTNFRPL